MSFKNQFALSTFFSIYWSTFWMEDAKKYQSQLKKQI